MDASRRDEFESVTSKFLEVRRRNSVQTRVPKFVGCISRYVHSEQDESEEVTFEVFVFVSSPFVRDASTYCSILSMNYEGPGAVCSEVSLQIESQLASECAKESGGTGESSFDYHCQKFRHSAQCAAISWSAHPSPHRSSSDLGPALRSSMHVERSCPVAARSTRALCVVSPFAMVRAHGSTVTKEERCQENQSARHTISRRSLY